MTGPFVEKDCTFTHEGRTFEAGGAVVTDDRLICYPADDGTVKTWHGEVLGTYRVLSSWHVRGPHGHREIYYSMRAVVNGVKYSLRGYGVGQVAFGKRLKGQRAPESGRVRVGLCGGVFAAVTAYFVLRILLGGGL